MALPTYDDVATLYLNGDKWSIHYVFPPPAAETHSVVEVTVVSLDKQTLNQVLNSIVEHAEPSF